MTSSPDVAGSRARPIGSRQPHLVRPLVLLAALWVSACGGDGGTEPEPAPQPNRPPAASGSIPAQTLTVGESTTVNAASLFTDPDGDALTYTAISSAPGTAAVALSGTTVTVTAVGAGTATITLTARDPGGLSAAVSGNITVEEPNRPPMAVGPLEPLPLAVGQTSPTLDLSLAFVDPDGDPLTYAGESDDPSVVTVSVTGSMATATAVAVGTATVTLTATDPDGLSASISGMVIVRPANRPPMATVSAIPPQTIETGDPVPVNVSAFFTDPDGDDLIFSAASGDTMVVTVSATDSTMTVVGVRVGMATVTLTATDPDGLSASLSGNLTVTQGANRAPVAVGGINAVARTVGWSGTLDLEGEDALFVDLDGDRLTYSAESSDPMVATVSATGSVVSVTAEAPGTAVGTVTATDPGGLSASVSFDVTVIPEAGTVLRDDFDDDSSLDNWEFLGAQAEVSDGMLRLTNDTTSSWGIAGHVLDAPLTSWEVRTSMGRASADSMRTALAFAPTNSGDLNFQLYRLQVGTQILNFPDSEPETVNYAFQAFFTPEGREEGWYFFGGDYRGESDAISDAAGELTDITVRVQDGTLEALAGDETLFSAAVGGTIFNSSLPEIVEVHFWTLDRAAANPGLLDWIEINGTPTGSSSNADWDDSYRRTIPPNLARSADVVREARAVCSTRNCR